jgi:hypothetical protein
VNLGCVGRRPLPASYAIPVLGDPWFDSPEGQERISRKLTWFFRHQDAGKEAATLQWLVQNLFQGWKGVQVHQIQKVLQEMKDDRTQKLRFIQICYDDTEEVYWHMDPIIRYRRKTTRSYAGSFRAMHGLFESVVAH